MSRWLLTIVAIVLVGCTAEPVETPSRSLEETNPLDRLREVVHVPPHVRDRIRMEAVVERRRPQTVTAPAEVSLDLSRVAKVSSRLEGQIEEVFVHLGVRIQRDQPLVAIGSLQLDELIQEYLVAKARMDVEQTAFRRAKILLEEQAISQRRFESDRAKYLETRAIFQHVREKLINLGLTVTDLRDLDEGSHVEGHHYLLKAPMGGTIISQDAVLGQGIVPGVELFQIADTSHVWVFANLSIEEAQRFRIGDSGLIIPKGRDPVTAPLAYLAPIADKQTLTVRVRFDVKNEGGRLKPNEYVEVKLMEEASAPPIMSIPIPAITLIDGVQGAFVPRDAGYAFVPLELGRETDGWIEVKSGVGLGDHVVAGGVFELKSLLLKDSINGD